MNATRLRRYYKGVDLVLTGPLRFKDWGSSLCVNRTAGVSRNVRDHHYAKYFVESDPIILDCT